MWTIAERLAKIVAPVAVIGALGYYIGVVREEALLTHFGLSPSLLAFSPQEYAIRSTDSLVRFVVVLSLIGLVLVGVYVALRAMWRRLPTPFARGIPVTALVAGTGSLLFGAWRLANPVPLGGLYLQGPVPLGLGAILLTYGAGTIHSSNGEWGLPDSTSRSVKWIGGACLTALMLMALFWAANDYAKLQGDERASDLESLSSFPTVVLYTHTRLASTLTTIHEDELDVTTSPMRYRYYGLRLFTKNNNKFFLISSAWCRTKEPIILLNDTEDIRLELSL
jgi:hypothetical protein